MASGWSNGDAGRCRRGSRVTRWSPLGRALLLLALAAGALSAQDRSAAALARGDSAWDAGNHALARQSYQQVIDADSARAARAVYRLATLNAWSNDLPSALALFQFYRKIEPRDDAGPVAMARTLAWASRFDESIALYDSVVARDSTARDAVLGAAQALAWASRLAESIGRYRRWTRSHSDDVEARLALAQALAWDGRLGESEAMYAKLSNDGAGASADKGMARVAAWRGDLDRSEEMWRALATRFPGDAEVWTGLAQVLRWSGHAAAARDALGRALVADPRYGDARNQLPWVAAELASALEPSVVTAFDRDRNYSTLAAVSASVTPPFDGRIVVTASRREASLGERYGGATLARGSATGLRVAATQLLDRGVTLRGALGATRLAPRAGDVPFAAAPGRTVMIASWAARASVHPWRTLGIGIGASRDPFDETATLIARGLAIQSIDGDAELALPGRLAVAAGASHADVDGGSVANARNAFTGSGRWRARRGLVVGVGARTFGYRANGRPDAYFSPARFTLVEFTTAWSLGHELGWWGTIDGGAGPQAIRFHSTDPGVRGDASRKLAERVAISAGFRFAPGFEAGISAGVANVASPTAIGVADYRAYTIGIRGRMRL